MKRIAAAGLALLMLLAARPAAAWDLSGTKTIVAALRDGSEVALGTVTFTPDGERTGFRVVIDPSGMKDYFLSMRGFKCLEASDEVTCFVPYPYANPGWVTKTDFRWLEHALLFMFKKPAEFGANLHNGLYYRLTLTEQGLVGEPNAVDLNEISFPPADPAKPPYDEAAQSPLPPGSRWVTGLRIR